eukprot:CAMPEP_0174905324 /NCGR_PEP_ID=MMETSP0167-20121228/52531_1 /TAXON_ID=38298 /ORGANISM="Rhodella maculata, Strain CCMP736" /LENGTH=124 /DNA_ID=CAMNT_0016148225 /DNA_START=88 /DNA_END=458 /DNA_ORIENTATION=-
MSVQHVDSLSSFNAVVFGPSTKLIVVDYYADWCGPCKAIAPLIEQLAAAHASTTTFVKVNVDVARDVASARNITAMPTFQLFKGGSMLEEFKGANPQKLTAAIAAHAGAPGPAAAFAGAGQRLG